MRGLWVLLWSVLPCALFAQERPIVQIEATGTETIVGQPLLVRIKVLVPTFAPTPPEFPSLEVPGVIVRLPERASGPISERVDGETWSGVQRSYRVYPLQAGQFEIPAQSVRVTYAEPGGIEPVSVDLPTEPILFQATVPAGAEGVSPLIVANDFRLTQTLEPPETFEVGDAVERRIEAQISGTTPVLIPQLIAPTEDAALRAYPKDPRVTESEDRGILSGSRIETTTYLGSAAGQATLPPIEFQWFNIETGTVEVARVEGVEITVAGAPASSQNEPVNWIRLLTGLVVAAALLWGGARLWPHIRQRGNMLRDRLRSSERYASWRVRKALKSQDLTETYVALGVWSEHFPEAPKNTLDPDLARVGRARLDAKSTAKSAEAWRQLALSYAQLRKACISRMRRDHHRNALPPMNPLGRP